MVSTPHNYFDGIGAEQYDDPEDPMFSAEVLDPTVDFLAHLAGDGRRSISPSAPAGGSAAVRSGVRVSGIELSEGATYRPNRVPLRSVRQL